MKKSAIFRGLELKGDAMRDKMLRPEGDDNADCERSGVEGMPSVPMSHAACLHAHVVVVAGPQVVSFDLDLMLSLLLFGIVDAKAARCFDVCGSSRLLRLIVSQARLPLVQSRIQRSGDMR